MKSAFTQIAPSPSSHFLSSPCRIRSNLLPYLVNAHDGSPVPGAQAVELCPKGLQVASLESGLGGAKLAAEQGGDGVDDHEPHHAPSQQQGQPPGDALLEGVLPHTHTGTVTQGTEPCWDTKSVCTAAPAQGVSNRAGSWWISESHQ